LPNGWDGRRHVALTCWHAAGLASSPAGLGAGARPCRDRAAGGGRPMDRASGPAPRGDDTRPDLITLRDESSVRWPRRIRYGWNQPFGGGLGWPAQIRDDRRGSRRPLMYERMLPRQLDLSCMVGKLMLTSASFAPVPGGPAYDGGRCCPGGMGMPWPRPSSAGVPAQQQGHGQARERHSLRAWGRV
jgi:hypothetical protein